MRFVWVILIFLSILGCTGSRAGSDPTQKNSINVSHLPQDPSKTDSSLVQVSSTYVNENKKSETMRIQGSGFLFSLESRWFVFTASHVSQGQDLRISWQKQDLKIIARLYQGLGDIELIEVSPVPSAKLSLSYDGQNFRWQQATISRAKWVDAFSFVLLNSDVQDQHLSIDNEFGYNRLDAISCDIYCRVLNTNTLLQPGSSGSPLITKNAEPSEFPLDRLQFDLREILKIGNPGEYFLRGMVIRRERFFSKSSFVPVRRLREILAAYLKDEKKDEDKKAFWRLQGFVLSRYQKNGGISESVLVSATVGNGTSVDGGNGTSVDGGNGTSVDGGTAGKIGENSPKSILEKVSSFPVSDGKSAFFWILMMRNPQKQLISYPLWFDMETYLSLGHFVTGLKGDPENITQIFSFRLTKSEFSVLMKSDDQISQFQFNDSKINLSLSVDQERINFQITKNGSFCQKNICSQRFDPIIEAISDSGKTYILDLRAFLFYDMTQSSLSDFKDPANSHLSGVAFNELFFEQMQKDSRILKIHLRPKLNLKEAMTAEQGQSTEIRWSLK